MMSANTPGTELFPFMFATWVFTLHVAGVTADDAVIRDACAAIGAANDATTGNQAGNTLVERIRALIPDDSPAAVREVATKLYGDRVKGDLGEGDRAEKTARIRHYQFNHQLPWLARIWERQDDRVVPNWLLVERVTDEVTAADPNPWNDADETRHLPVADFLVLWELDGCTSVYLS
jgi:hypothetical protein